VDVAFSSPDEVRGDQLVGAIWLPTSGAIDPWDGWPMTTP
jgi:hypothetical protein